MVGGNHVDGAVQNALHQSIPIFPTAQRGIHFEPAVLLQHAVIHYQVVGAGFAGDVQSLGLGLADQLHAFLGGDVADVVGNSGLCHQLQVPGNLTPLAFGADAPVIVGLGVAAVVNVAAPEQGVVLAVGHNELAQSLGPKHGLLHHLS